MRNLLSEPKRSSYEKIQSPKAFKIVSAIVLTLRATAAISSSDLFLRSSLAITRRLAIGSTMFSLAHLAA